MIKTTIHYKLITSLLLLHFVIITIVVTTSCDNNKPVIDPDSSSPGYKLFTGTSKGFRISFEYPDTWRRGSVKRVKSYTYLPLLPTDSRIIITSDMSKNRGADYNASKAIQSILNTVSKYAEFRIISRNSKYLGQIEGEEVIYSHLFPGEDPHKPPVYASIGEEVIGRMLSVDHKGYTYFIDFLSAAKAYDDATISYLHIIRSLEFLD